MKSAKRESQSEELQEIASARFASIAMTCFSLGREWCVLPEFDVVLRVTQCTIIGLRSSILNGKTAPYTPPGHRVLTAPAFSRGVLQYAPTEICGPWPKVYKFMPVPTSHESNFGGVAGRWVEFRNFCGSGKGGREFRYLQPWVGLFSFSIFEGRAGGWMGSSKVRRVWVDFLFSKVSAGSGGISQFRRSGWE